MGGSDLRGVPLDGGAGAFQEPFTKETTGSFYFGRPNVATKVASRKSKAVIAVPPKQHLGSPEDERSYPGIPWEPRLPVTEPLIWRLTLKKLPN